MSRCRSCGATIVFARHFVTERVMPMEESADGTWVVTDGFARPFEPLLHGNATRYSSHFATCPEAPKWRRDR